jgi:cysteinyl-tRNA synthetase
VKKMAIKFFNTLTRKKEVFKPLHRGEVRMYSCGPTVYAPPHIGNMRSFLVSDLVRRYLEFSGFKVKLVMNLTDIDDKTIRDSGEEGISLKEFTERWVKVFFDNIDLLNIKRASIYPKATEHIEEMIEFVRGLVRKDIAYEKSGSVYYDISKFKKYGKLSKLDLEGIKIGATIDADEYDKDNPRDFSLLKRSTTEELKRGIFYKTEWGNVRPGWHLECSVLSMKYLGETFDIHSGGVDLIFPHHENEIAQSEAYTGKKFVRYWIHNEHLLVNGLKMSKSLGNYITLAELLEKLSPEIVRYMFASVHYRQKINYTEEFARNAKRNYEKLKETFDKLHFALKSAVTKGDEHDEAFLKKLKSIKKEFIVAMDDDLNTPLALKSFHELSKEINKYLEKNKNRKSLDGALNLLNEFADVLGLKFKEGGEKTPEEIKELIQKREEARKKKDWKLADEIRLKIKELGYVIEDTPDGIRCKK